MYRCIYMYRDALLPSCTCRAGIRHIEKRGKRGKRGKKMKKMKKRKKRKKRKTNNPDRAQPKVLDHPDSSIIKISIECASASGSLCWIELENRKWGGSTHHARKKGLSIREHPPQNTTAPNPRSRTASCTPSAIRAAAVSHPPIPVNSAASLISHRNH